MQGVPVEFPTALLGVVVYRPPLAAELLEDALDLGSVRRGGAVAVYGEICFPQVEQLRVVGLQGLEAAAGEVEAGKGFDLLERVEWVDCEKQREVVWAFCCVVALVWFWVVHGVRG